MKTSVTPSCECGAFFSHLQLLEDSAIGFSSVYSLFNMRYSFLKSSSNLLLLHFIINVQDKKSFCKLLFPKPFNLTWNSSFSPNFKWAQWEYQFHPIYINFKKWKKTTHSKSQFYTGKHSSNYQANINQSLTFTASLTIEYTAFAFNFNQLCA